MPPSNGAHRKSGKRRTKRSKKAKFLSRSRRSWRSRVGKNRRYRGDEDPQTTFPMRTDPTFSMINVLEWEKHKRFAEQERFFDFEKAALDLLTLSFLLVPKPESNEVADNISKAYSNFRYLLLHPSNALVQVENIEKRAQGSLEMQEIRKIKKSVTFLNEKAHMSFDKPRMIFASFRTLFRAAEEGEMSEEEKQHYYPKWSEAFKHYVNINWLQKAEIPHSNPFFDFFSRAVDFASFSQ